MRKFDASADLTWHYDETDRVIIPLAQTDWCFQQEWEEQPKKIDGNIVIQAGVYHRLVPGKGELILIICDLPEGTVNSADPEVI